MWKDLITLYVVSMQIFETWTVLLRPLASGRPLVVFNVMGIAPTNFVVNVLSFLTCRMFFGAHEVMSEHRVSRQRVSRNASLRCLFVCCSAQRYLPASYRLTGNVYSKSVIEVSE